jgi:hypothetical protein
MLSVNTYAIPSTTIDHTFFTVNFYGLCLVSFFMIQYTEIYLSSNVKDIKTCPISFTRKQKSKQLPSNYLAAKRLQLYTVHE